MPADYQTTAEGLSVSASPSPPPFRDERHSESDDDNDNDNDNNDAHHTTNQRRLSTARFRSVSVSLPTGGPGGAGAGAMSTVRRAWEAAERLNEHMMRTWEGLTTGQRVLAVAAVAMGWVVLIVGWIFSHRVFEWLGRVSETWRALPGGWLIVFLLVFLTSFPPLMSYSTACTVGGFVYGFPLGWPIVASACVAGSLACFLACRTFLGARVERFIGSDARFVALGQVLRRDGILYLTGVRFCPLPFSISNAFLATVPSITPSAFALSTALSSPKLLVHVFIGSRLAILAESGDEMSFGARMVNYLSMAAGGAVGLAVGWVIYQRTMARAAELAREANAAEEGRSPFSPGGGPGPEYADQEDGLMDPEDAAALMSDDDMSLWENPGGDWDDREDGQSGEATTTKHTRQDSW